MKVKNK